MLDQSDCYPERQATQETTSASSCVRQSQQQQQDDGAAAADAAGAGLLPPPPPRSGFAVPRFVLWGRTSSHFSTMLTYQMILLLYDLIKVPSRSYTMQRVDGAKIHGS
jgi:hypothetical protein